MVANITETTPPKNQNGHSCASERTPRQARYCRCVKINFGKSTETSQTGKSTEVTPDIAGDRERLDQLLEVLHLKAVVMGTGHDIADVDEHGNKKGLSYILNIARLVLSFLK